VDYYDRARQNFDRARVQLTGGATRWVLRNGRPLIIGDLSRSDLGVELHGDPGVRSWMGVPLVIYGNVDGVLAIQSRSPNVFDEERLRLLDAIGAQAAVALENARLYEMAMVDGLTKLFVRRYFDGRLEEEIERANRFSTVFSVVIMDIDNFKQLNDTHGHIAGDRMLRGIADIVRSQMRAVDTAARYGGEEFSMLLPRTTMVDALNQAERIRTMIDEFRLVTEGGDGTVVSTTASFGIASYPESKARSAEELVRLADRALYRAKHAGKNRVELYWADDDARVPPLSVVRDSEERPTRKR
jgi:diguanylate cyclase (GGDEF)-like protein